MESAFGNSCFVFFMTEKVPRLPSPGGVGLHLKQQDVRNGAEPADLGGSHRLSQGRGDARHLHEGQRRRGQLEDTSGRLPEGR